MNPFLPIGKYPSEHLAQLLSRHPVKDHRVVLGPGIGLDCAVLDMGEQLLVLKSDPITFTSEEIGWYAVQVNANDIVTTGAVPRWMLVTLLLPEANATIQMVETIYEQLTQACQSIGVEIVGGHTEVTYNLDRPIIVGTMLGEVARDKLITPRGASPGDRILLTKGVPIEATSILARQFRHQLEPHLTDPEILEASHYLYQPGISVIREAQIAVQVGRVTAMHDPTEGGVAMALWELAEASGRSIYIDPQRIPIPPLSARLCQIFEINPLEAIASGALLLTSPPEDAPLICQACAQAGILCTEIGWVEQGKVGVWQSVDKDVQLLPRPQRDAIARLYE